MSLVLVEAKVSQPVELIPIWVGVRVGVLRCLLDTLRLLDASCHRYIYFGAACGPDLFQPKRLKFPSHGKAATFNKEEHQRKSKPQFIFTLCLSEWRGCARQNQRPHCGSMSEIEISHCPLETGSKNTREISYCIGECVAFPSKTRMISSCSLHGNCQASVR